MATTVLSIAGGFIGAAIAGPAGAFKGYEVGAAVGALIGAAIDLSNAPTTTVGALSDLKVMSSSYGTAIPILWGRYRIGGQLIWIKTDANRNHLVRHESSHSAGGGSGGGGGKVKSVSYSASFAIGIGTTLHGCQVRKIFADDTVIFGTGATNPPEMRFYHGTSTQEPDDLIEAWAVAFPDQSGGHAPAYRDWAYIVFEDMDLGPYSNRIPNISIEFETDPITLSMIMEDVAGMVGIDVVSELDVSAATGQSILGVISGNRQSAHDVAVIPAAVYQFDMIETDGKIRLLKRGGAVVGTIDYDDLGAQTISSGSGDVITHITETYTQITDMPRSVDVMYLATNNDFQSAAQHAVRQTVDTDGESSITLPMVLSDQDAMDLAQRTLILKWLESVTYGFNLPPKYFAWTPGDVVYLPTLDNLELRRVRITSVDTGMFGELRFTAVPDSQIITQTGIVVAAPTPITNPPVDKIIPTDFRAWSGDEIRDEDGLRPGFYVAATGDTGWPGCTVYYSGDSGSTWQTAELITSAATMGTASTTLADGVTPEVFDLTSNVHVTMMDHGQLSSVTTAQVQAGENIALLGDEIIGFSTATLTSTDHYTLSDIWRGLRGTSMLGHTSADRFIVLTSDTVTRISVATALVGATVKVKCLSPGQVLSDVTAIDVVISTPNHPYITPKTVPPPASSVPTLPTPDATTLGKLYQVNGVGIDSTTYIGTQKADGSFDLVQIDPPLNPGRINIVTALPAASALTQGVQYLLTDGGTTDDQMWIGVRVAGGTYSMHQIF